MELNYYFDTTTLACRRLGGIAPDAAPGAAFHVSSQLMTIRRTVKSNLRLVEALLRGGTLTSAFCSVLGIGAHRDEERSAGTLAEGRLSPTQHPLYHC